MATTPPATPQATESGIHLDSVVTGVSHLRVGPGLVFDTPKSKCRGKVRQYGAKRTLFDAGDRQGDRRVSALALMFGFHLGLPNKIKRS